MLVGSRTVAVVAQTAQGEFVVTRQFRVGPGRVLHELPGGVVEDGEDVVAAGIRELLEETGYAAGSAELVGRTWLAANATTRRHVVVALGCRQVADPTPDADEAIETHLLSATEFVALVRSGDLTDQGSAYRALDALGLLTDPA